MAAKDKFHQELKNALVKDGWTVTNDPYVLKIGGKKQEIDFGAEKIIAAEKDGQKVAIELKSFLSDSPFNDFYEALGQYMSYEIGLSVQSQSAYLSWPLPKKPPAGSKSTRPSKWHLN